jgi:8-oxo-dGTP pyrophosphatase MutT (NUDIX family)
MSLDPPSSALHFDVAALRDRARNELPAPPLDWGLHTPRTDVVPPSDFDLNPGSEHEWQAKVTPRPAAVLVPIVMRDSLAVILTQRTEDLPAHAGQIAFPGGKAEAGDKHPLATALREASEEIGLAEHLCEPIGCLDRYRTGTGFEITPIIALIDPGFRPVADPREVADVFEVPLAFLMDPANHHQHSRHVLGRARQFYAMPYGERYIWGATAGILRNMHERLFVLQAAT